MPNAVIEIPGGSALGKAIVAHAIEQDFTPSQVIILQKDNCDNPHLG